MLSRTIKAALLPVLLTGLALGTALAESRGWTGLGPWARSLLAPVLQPLGRIAALPREPAAGENETAPSLAPASARLAFENQVLREKLQDLTGVRERPVESFRLVDARVLYLTGWEDGRRLAVVDRGREHGVTADLGVLKGERAVGRVLRAGSTLSVVRFLTDPGCKVPVTVLAVDTSAPADPEKYEGLLEGRLCWNEGVQVRHVHLSVPVIPGDSVLTSGRLGHFPPGCLAATVCEVRDETTAQFHAIRARSEVAFRHLRTVLIAVPTAEARAQARDSERRAR